MPLQGAELEEFLAKERAAKEKEAAKKAAEDRRQRILEADAEDTDDEDDTDGEMGLGVGGRSGRRSPQRFVFQGAASQTSIFSKTGASFAPNGLPAPCWDMDRAPKMISKQLNNV